MAAVGVHARIGFERSSGTVSRYISAAQLASGSKKFSLSFASVTKK
jgi:hypothetical protein